MSINTDKKKRGRPATGQDPLMALRMPKHMTEALMAWAAQQPDKPGKSEALRRIVSHFLQRRGFLSKQ
jgi:mannose/cellobiose epimerase-like protein (N-acyl-D-glucosamine 2-epimerase family)